MKFSAVKHHFKPISGEARHALVRKHGGSGRGEQSVFLDEVGLDQVARKVVQEAARKSSTETPKVYSF
ncbi:hypothetical protein [Hydrogenophaga sp.]|uniref:hypothetical protein n=1 Tax=Hydrogenophaga sp. TaxID=1904254 RepID=UPI0027302DE2|nr:hypothetical protein [Hydrogenophaga sp.]MDP1684619.1 hypothetical protein [Hydrogenophaga sp.]